MMAWAWGLVDSKTLVFQRLLRSLNVAFMMRSAAAAWDLLEPEFRLAFGAVGQGRVCLVGRVTVDSTPSAEDALMPLLCD